MLCPKSYLILDPVKLQPRLQLETEGRDGGDLKSKRIRNDCFFEIMYELTCGDLVNWKRYTVSSS